MADNSAPASGAERAQPTATTDKVKVKRSASIRSLIFLSPPLAKHRLAYSMRRPRALCGRTQKSTSPPHLFAFSSYTDTRRATSGKFRRRMHFQDFKEESTMTNCLCNLFADNWVWLIILALILISCCGCN
jgi:hypothetical protein